MSAPTPPATGKSPQGHADIKHASSPEALDNLIVTTKPRAWLALWAIAAALVVALIWSVVAVIPLQKSATGIVNPYVYTRVVSATTEGTFTTNLDPVQDATLEKNTTNAGDILGTITPYDGGSPVDVVAPVGGALTAIYVNQGDGVVPGAPLLEIVTQPTKENGLAVIAWVPQSTALSLEVGSTSVVTITDTTYGDTFQVDATLSSKADVPSSEQSIATLTDSVSLAEQWMAESGGAPYRIGLTLDLESWPADRAYPPPGSVVTIVSTYSELHPIQLLFGGS